MNEIPEHGRALLAAALQQPEHAREAFLRQACGADKELFARLSRVTSSSLSDAVAGASPDGVPSAQVTSSSDSASSPSGPDLGAEFNGTDRFIVERRLGSGGFGVVYQVRDLRKGTTVALKRLPNVTSESLFRFKREFRALANVSHPNLVQLYELASEDGQWFFTMELIQGRHFLEHVRDVDAEPGTAPPLARLIAAARQLVGGLAALHSLGHLHRDVKPSNVLVTADGRVVLLDFGLVTDLQPDAGAHTMHVAGTPLYMSPEQAAGLPLTAASDVYSVGIMLYQALTGTAPFHGSFLQIVNDKQRADPAPPGTVSAGIPPALDALCTALLRRDFVSRPSAGDILDCLDQVSSAVPTVAAPPAPVRETSQLFVGRQRQLEALAAAFDRMVAGHLTVAAVYGPSGIGKTVLVRTFLDRIRSGHPETVVLTGRCYERESVPFKGVDSLVDVLARHLRRLPVHDVAAVLPRDAASLAQLFPVLGQFLDRVPHRLAVPPDSQEVRRRAFGALRELLARLGDKQPLVLFVDDLQWGDADSAGLLAEILRPPDPPSLLFIAAYRDVETQTSPFLRAFLSDAAAVEDGVIDVAVDALAVEEARALAEGLLGGAAPATKTVAAAIAAEAGGSPFFIDELVRAAEAGSTPTMAPPASPHAHDSEAREATLAHMIQLRMARLPEPAQRLLNLIAVNARPTPERVLTRAAGVADAEAMLALLRSEHLVRARETGHGTELEAYHDRIRETISRHMDRAKLREAHARLAAAFEGEEAVLDAELVAEHLLAADDAERALRYIIRAAEEAERALAFDRAARLYRRSLDVLEPASDRRAALMLKLADALANAGRGAEAAAVYLEAPVTAPAEILDCKQRAAQQLLFGGHVDQGTAIIRDVLRSVGLKLPETRLGTIAALLVGRARVRVRGLRFNERPLDVIAADELMKIDACWSVSAGLGVVDTTRAAVFQTHQLLCALRAGELERVHRALCLEVAFLGVSGSRTLRRARAVMATTDELSQRIANPYARALHRLMCGVTEYLNGYWKEGAAALTDAEGMLRDHCTGVTWELDSSRMFSVWCQYWLGNFREMSERFPTLLKDARDRGDLYASTMIGGHAAHFVFLCADDPAAAREHTREAISRWSQHGFHMQHLWEFWSYIDIAVYEGQGHAAWAQACRIWPELERSMLLSVQLMRISMLDLRARAALAAAGDAAGAHARESALKDALWCAGRMERQGTRWGDMLAQWIRVGVLSFRDERAASLRVLHEIERSAEQQDMAMYAAVARIRRGELLGGGEGAALVENSETWMRSQSIRNPRAFAFMLAPWKPNPS